MPLRIRGHINYPEIPKAAPVPVRKPALGRDLWTPHQDALIRKVYPQDGGVGLSERFGRTLKSITSRAQFLGVRFSP